MRRIVLLLAAAAMLVMMSVAPAVAQEDPADPRTAEKCGEVSTDSYTDAKDVEKRSDKFNEYCVPLGERISLPPP